MLIIITCVVIIIVIIGWIDGWILLFLYTVIIAVLIVCNTILRLIFPGLLPCRIYTIVPNYRTLGLKNWK